MEQWLKKDRSKNDILKNKNNSDHPDDRHSAPPRCGCLSLSGQSDRYGFSPSSWLPPRRKFGKKRGTSTSKLQRSITKKVQAIVTWLLKKGQLDNCHQQSDTSNNASDNSGGWCENSSCDA